MTVNTGSDFVRVKGTSFVLNNEIYSYIGTNFWYGMNLASLSPGGNRKRLILELDILHALGILNLRIMAGSEGPDSSPWRILPAVQTSPGVYNTELLEGLDFLLTEMGKRGMKAVLCLTNFWEWTGGLAQYLLWHGAGPIPYPNIRKEWHTFQQYTARFFSETESKRCLNSYIHFLISRVNSCTGIPYRDDPVIMSWQLCNEPRGMNNESAFNRWIDDTSAFIKNLDPNHLISTGTEGSPPFRHAGVDFIKNNSFSCIDYTTAHLWVQNWNIYKPGKHKETFNHSVKFAIDYIDEHIKKSEMLNKPFVLEEFGFPRDFAAFSPGSTTINRDKFYDAIFEKIASDKYGNRTGRGVNFWAWSGTGRPSEPYGSFWNKGCELLGDPPHEPQGWYGVYNTDTTTGIIRNYSSRFSKITADGSREI